MYNTKLVIYPFIGLFYASFILLFYIRLEYETYSKGDGWIFFYKTTTLCPFVFDFIPYIFFYL